MRRTFLHTLALITAVAPVLGLAQYSEIKMGEYLHYAVAAANGGVYAGINGIGYTGVGFGNPSIYKTNTGWVDLPSSLGFNTASPYYGQPKGISHDGSVLVGYMIGVAATGISIEYAAYWVNGVESLVPAPPDDPAPTLMSATGVSGDGTTLIVQDQTANKTESYVFNIASGQFTSLGFFGGTNQQTYATAINNDGSIVAGYYNLDNGNIHGFLWNAADGLLDLGIPTSHPNTYYLEPACISDDGTIVFGRLTELNGWLGFLYNTTTGFQDLGDITPSACTADGTEAVGIENMYFPAVWSVGNGSGYLDHLLSANGTTQALGTTEGPVTISPDGSAITALGPDAYLTDQIWYGTWQIFLPVPLKTAPIPQATQTFSTDYRTTLTEPEGTLTQYAEFNTGVSAILVKRPHYASAFVLNADGSFSYTPEPDYISNGIDPETGTPTDTFTYQLASPNGISANAQVQINVLPPMAPTVTAIVNRLVFYNNSAWDGNDPGANSNDDNAVATDKAALLPGGAASFANYTSYSRGINGIMVDIAGLAGTPTTDDFLFNMGNDNSPGGWATAPAPSIIAVRPGAGTNGSDRVTIIWADNAIQKQWLQVTVQATAQTGLSAPDVFYFGNAIGESGNSTANAQVDISDENAARQNPANFLHPASLTDPCDYNRDQRVDVSDENIARQNNTNFLTVLKLISPP